MLPRRSPHPPGLIVVPRGDLGRYAHFDECLERLLVPEGSAYAAAYGSSVAQNINTCLRQFLGNPEWAWVWVMGDDHVFADDLLLRLLAHDKDIIVPLCLRKVPPYSTTLTKGYVKPHLFEGWRIEDLPPDGGLLQVLAAGSAGMVIRRAVIEKMADPWMEYGQVDPESLGEDTYFCLKARELGYDTWCDLDAVLGHCTTHSVWPRRMAGGQWGVGAHLGGEVRLEVRMAKQADGILLEVHGT